VKQISECEQGVYRLWAGTVHEVTHLSSKLAMGINEGCSVRLVLWLGRGICAVLLYSVRLAQANTAFARSEGDGRKASALLTGPTDKGLIMRVAAVEPGVFWLKHPLALFAGIDESDKIGCRGSSPLSPLFNAGVC
jgi:hypothetical protein